MAKPKQQHYLNGHNRIYKTMQQYACISDIKYNF